MRTPRVLPTSWVDGVAGDLSHAIRSVRHSAGFAFIAVLVLAIGIGANTAIFTLVDAMRAHRLPYRDPSRLVTLIGTVQRTRVERRGASYPDFVDWRTEARSFEGLAAFDGQMITLNTGREAERIDSEFVSGTYFDLLGVRAATGRAFTATDDDTSGPMVVVLGDGLWKRRFGSDPGIVGRSITLNGVSCMVLGVMPPGFKGLTDRADAWMPFARYAPPAAMANRGQRGFMVLARLKPSATVAGARQDLALISRRLAQRYPATNEGRSVEVEPVDSVFFGEVRPALLMLLGAVGFVLLIACASVANLTLARMERRRGEIAIRLAMGATRARLARQFVTESCVFTVSAAAAGVALARAATSGLIAYSPVRFPSFITPALDMRVAAFTIGVSLACGIAIGLVPALQTTGDLLTPLSESARQSSAARSRRVRSGLVVANVALALVLLVGAGLMLDSLRNLAAVRPGFDPDSVLTVHASIPRVPATGSGETGAPQTASRPLIDGRTLLARLGALPGVRAVALGNDVPLDGGGSAAFYAAEGQPEVPASTMPRAYIHRVSPGFFGTLRIPIVAGRTFHDNESTADAAVAIVSENVARRFWPGQNPLGRRIEIGRTGPAGPWLSIVGVVGEVKYRGLPENPTSDPDIYLPFADRNQQIAIVVRTDRDPILLEAPLRASIQQVDTSIPVYNVAPLQELIGEQGARPRFTTWLMGVFATVALVLAAIGLYGVMSYLVVQRTREIGIRVALGAPAARVLRLVVGHGARLVAMGVACGLPLSFALARLVSAQLYEARATHPWTLLPVSALVAASLIACYVPARRATRLDPVRALRHE